MNGISKHWDMIESEKNKMHISAKCSLCKGDFQIKPFERNLICWGMRHTETTTFEEPKWCCPKCKEQLNLFMTKILMGKKKWKVDDQNEH